ncbi:glycosyltransferase [Paraglaciecola chathamensis]|uniref:glycosyltransferase n=1 Tax=Paraglaciecola chathamensis TaxID=368405 RepID=UPI0026F8665A|nr:glycosyltransferase [Paraglaciecola chathamensis]MDO6560394.1 glycosyltransferase [Paraglaciecola chathamensis]MDO6838041.1 glycosyltransferase [Paraglaciecola chathamensis]
MQENISIVTPIRETPDYEAVIGLSVYSGDNLTWVKQAIESLFTQSNLKYIFCIVIDGPVKSEVNSYLVSLVNEDARLNIFRGQYNVGLSRSMNFLVDWALENAPSAKYFFRMDADDISLENRLEKQISFLNANPSISVLGSGLTEINEDGEKVGQRKLPLKHHEIMRFLPKRCSINHPTVAIRFDVFRKGFRYRGDLKNTQDYFFWADLAAAGFKFANLPDKLLQFRRVNDFYKRRGYSKSLNEFKARFYTMKVLNRYSIGNVVYACSVLILRLMPAKLVKLAYKLDRYLLNKRVKHE